MNCFDLLPTEKQSTSAGRCKVTTYDTAGEAKVIFYTAVRSQKTVTAYSSNKQWLYFGLAWQYSTVLL